VKENKNSFVDSITRKRSFSFGKNKQQVSASANKEEPTSNVAKAKKEVEKNPAPVQTVSNKATKKDKTQKKFKFLEFKKPKRFLSWHGSFIILFLLPIFLFAIVSYLYQTHNEGRIYTGVTTFGLDVGGKTREEAGKMIDEKIGSYKLAIEGANQKFEAGYNDLGVNYDKETILSAAYSYGRDDNLLNNFINRAKRFFSQYEVALGSQKYSFQTYDVKLVYKVDDAKMDKYLADLESKINVQAQDSQITNNRGSVQITPAVFGRKMRTAELKQQILNVSTNFESTPLKIETDVASPTILDEKTKELAEQADQITSKGVTLAYNGKTYTPSKATLVTWVTFTRANDSAPWQMVIDRGKMVPYFKTVGKEINVYSVDHKIRVENETKEVVTQEGKDGLIIDEAVLGSQLASKLQSDDKISMDIPMKVDKFKIKKDHVVVANWDKYIDINISTQHMDAYLKGGQRVGSWAITSGKNGWNTPTGQFLVLRKAYNVCMPNPPSTQPLCGIHYVSYFTGAGHAIHQAWWRSYFGGQDYKWNGSHGCVNAPISVAQFIYNWAPVGTPVTIHY